MISCSQSTFALSFYAQASAQGQLMRVIAYNCVKSMCFTKGLIGKYCVKNTRPVTSESVPITRSAPASIPRSRSDILCPRISSILIADIDTAEHCAPLFMCLITPSTPRSEVSASNFATLPQLPMTSLSRPASKASRLMPSSLRFRNWLLQPPQLRVVLLTRSTGEHIQKPVRMY